MDNKISGSSQYQPVVNTDDPVMDALLRIEHEISQPGCIAVSLSAHDARMLFDAAMERRTMPVSK